MEHQDSQEMPDRTLLLPASPLPQPNAFHAQPESQDHKDKPGLQEHQDQTDNQDKTDTQVSQELQEPQDHKEMLERQETMDNQDKMVVQDRTDGVDMELQEHQEHRELQEPQEIMEHQDKMELQDKPEHQDQLDQMDSQEPREEMDNQERMDSTEFQEQTELTAHAQPEAAQLRLPQLAQTNSEDVSPTKFDYLLYLCVVELFYLHIYESFIHSPISIFFLSGHMFYSKSLGNLSTCNSVSVWKLNIENMS